MKLSELNRLLMSKYSRRGYVAEITDPNNPYITKPRNITIKGLRKIRVEEETREDIESGEWGGVRFTLKKSEEGFYVFELYVYSSHLEDTGPVLTSSTLFWVIGKADVYVEYKDEKVKVKTVEDPEIMELVKEIEKTKGKARNEKRHRRIVDIFQYHEIEDP